MCMKKKLMENKKYLQENFDIRCFYPRVQQILLGRLGRVMFLLHVNSLPKWILCWFFTSAVGQKIFFFFAFSNDKN